MKSFYPKSVKIAQRTDFFKCLFSHSCFGKFILSGECAFYSTTIILNQKISHVLRKKNKFYDTKTEKHFKNLTFQSVLGNFDWIRIELPHIFSSNIAKISKFNLLKDEIIESLKCKAKEIREYSVLCLKRIRLKKLLC